MSRSDFRVALQLYVLLCFLVILVFGSMARYTGREDWLLSILAGTGTWLFLTVPVSSWLQWQVDRLTGRKSSQDDQDFYVAGLLLFGLPINVTIVHGIVG